MTDNNKITCKSCDSFLNGIYCSDCGEKVVSDKDFSLKSLFNQSLGAITSLDSKFLITFISLFFKPGKLTREFVLGRRKRYMQPFQVFVLSNLVFFLFLTSSDIFRSPAKWYFQSPEIKKQVETICADKKISEREFAQIYDSESGSIAKSAVIIIIPFLGLVLWLLNIRKKFLFGKHLISATHFFSFLLLFIVFLSFAVAILPNSNALYVQIPILTSIFIYISVVQRTFYLDTFLVSISKGAAGMAAITLILFAYRDVVSLISMKILK